MTNIIYLHNKDVLVLPLTLKHGPQKPRINYKLKTTAVQRQMQNAKVCPPYNSQNNLSKTFRSCHLFAQPFPLETSPLTINSSLWPLSFPPDLILYHSLTCPLCSCRTGLLPKSFTQQPCSQMRALALAGSSNSSPLL